MSRRDAIRRVQHSLYDIENDISSLTSHRMRSKVRYTSISVPQSNVSPIRRRNSRSDPKKTTTRSATTNKRTKSNVVNLHDKRNPTSIARVSRTLKRNLTPETKKQTIKTDVLWHPKKRARIFALVLLVPFVFISMKLFDVQVLKSDKYTSMGVSQRKIVREIVPERGTITDRNGNILAVSQPAYTVIADPSVLEDPDELLDELHKITVFKDEDVASRLRKKDSRYAVVVRQVDEATAKRVQKAALPGISVIRDNKREYPARDIAGNVIGFVGSEMNGLGGLEYMLNTRLTGKKGEEAIERDPKGREIPSTRKDIKDAQRGQDITTTLDQGIQYETQRIVLQEVAATKSKGGTAIVADVKTGEILSMVSVVDGPDSPQLASPQERNHAVADVYEPGSTNKVITVSGALEEKIISPGTTFNVPDVIYFDNHPFTDHNPHPITTWTAGDILRESSNVGTIMISQKLKKANLDKYMRAYGFGSKSALNFPGEAKGILLDPKNWSETSYATVPVGNGLAVTPLQMLSVYMTIANNGVKVDPKMIKGFISSDGTLKDADKGKSTRVISETTAKQLQVMLAGAVKDGTGQKAVVSGYSVAGKTGTARKPPYDKPPYKYIASFAGFAPAKNPRIATIVVLDEPQGQIYGGTVAAPVFSRVMQTALRVYGVQPDQPVQGQSITNAPSVAPTTKPKTTTP